MVIIVKKAVREILVSLGIFYQGDPLQTYRMWFYYGEEVFVSSLQQITSEVGIGRMLCNRACWRSPRPPHLK